MAALTIGKSFFTSRPAGSFRLPRDGAHRHRFRCPLRCPVTDYWGNMAAFFVRGHDCRRLKNQCWRIRAEDYETVALPTELRRPRRKMLTRQDRRCGQTLRVSI